MLHVILTGILSSVYPIYIYIISMCYAKHWKLEKYKMNKIDDAVCRCS